MKYSSDTELLEQEREGYVVEDNNTEVDPYFNTHISIQDMVDDEDESVPTADVNVFPLQVHGVLDSEVLDLSNNKVLAHVLTNTSASEAYSQIWL
ncbi:hypothetical protein BDR06DRAFT_1003576 [Suillus hirtellus]|nr:hypothetical protein BDR06DRAFT_1003576 [Suillus hirtellus]